MTAARRLAAPALALALGALAGCSYPRLWQDGRVDEAYLDRVARATSDERGIPLDAPIPHAVISRDEARARLARAIEADGTADLASQALAYEALGLLPPGTDLARELRSLLGEQVAAYYDPGEKKFFIVDAEIPGADAFSVKFLSWMTDKDVVGEFVASHELVHALQDRRYDLERYLRGAGADDDAALARRAVVEGDAMLHGIRTLFRSLGAAPKDGDPVLDRGALGLGGDELARAPAILREQLLSPYLDGYGFVKAVTVPPGGGRDPWADPPASTHEILHPERYLEHALRPHLQIERVRAPAGYTLVRENTLGELGARVLFEGSEATKELALAATCGLAGDRYRVFRNERTGAFAFACLLAFESLHEQHAFADAIARSPAGPGRVRACVTLLEMTTLCVAEAPDGDAFDALRESALHAVGHLGWGHDASPTSRPASAPTGR